MEEEQDKFYTWTVEFKVHASWVADGFDLTDERAHNMLAKYLSWAYNDEIEAKILIAPNPLEIRKEQGYV